MKNLQVAPLRARTRRCARRSGGEALGVDVDVAVADLVDVAAQLWPVVAAGDVDGARQRPPGPPHGGPDVSEATRQSCIDPRLNRGRPSPCCARRRPARPALSRRAAGRGSPPAPPRGRAFRRGRDRRLEQPTGRPSCTRSPERLAWPTSRWPRRRQLVRVPGPRPRTAARPARTLRSGVGVWAPAHARPPSRAGPDSRRWSTQASAATTTAHTTTAVRTRSVRATFGVWPGRRGRCRVNRLDYRGSVPVALLYLGCQCMNSERTVHRLGASPALDADLVLLPRAAAFRHGAPARDGFA